MTTAHQAILARIREQGPIRFDDFMQLALYHPMYGYYSKGEGIFGQSGDFITAPELSPLFGQTIGKALATTLPRCNNTVYEFGAGNGKLASHVLNTAGEQIDAYHIVELSGGLRQAQQSRLRSVLPPQLFAKVTWLDHLPEQMRGIVIGNEVLDALPVRRFTIHKQQIHEQWVGLNNAGELHIQNEIAPHKVQRTLQTQLETLHTGLNEWPNGYEFEWDEQAQALVATITQRLQGAVLMIDYGYHEALYYHPARNMGTLRAHSKHVAHSGFLEQIGEQDLTAHVNFSAIYKAALASGGTLEGYTTQAKFLMAHGVLELAREDPHFIDPVAGASSRQALHKLLSETEMGESFKVICWSRNVDLEGCALAIQFAQFDESHYL